MFRPSSRVPWFLVIIVMGAVGLLVYAGWKNHRSTALRREAEQLKSATVTIYGPQGHPTVDLAAASLQLRNIKHKIVSVSDYNELVRAGLVERAKAAGLMSNQSMSLPIMDVGGELYGAQEFQRMVQAIPLATSQKPYLLVYGPRDCPKTARKISELAQRGIPYEYRDVNSSQYRPEFEAKVLSTGNKWGDWPFVDVRGHFLFSPPIEDIEKLYGPAR